MKKRTVKKHAPEFVDEFAALLTPWGMNVTTGRVYGYILLQQQPASLDRIAADLKISRVGAWHAARRLEGFGHVRRYGEAGSKRALYGPTDRFDGPLLQQCALFGALASLLDAKARSLDRDGATERLQKMSALFADLKQAMETTIERSAREGKAS